MKILIVDDEQKSRNLLKMLCENYCEDIRIVGLADSVEIARQLIDEQTPDLVFLDIHMPVDSGFSLLETYGEHIPFEVIFTTAYDHFALEAFRYTALDYLLKPIDIQELIDAVDKVRRKQQPIIGSSRLSDEERREAAEAFDKMALPTDDGVFIVNLQDIIRFEAESNYTKMYLADGQLHLITKTLKYFEEILSGKGFFRVHRSHLINLRHVRRYLKGKRSQVEMADEAAVEVALRRRDALLVQLARMH
ncbi:MAG: LytTR family DNA-binding domain-containing protein [Bacteroidota bacterium]